MALSKEDPVYYKAKLEKLLKEAEENDVRVFIEGNAVFFFSHHECAGVAIYKED